MNVYEMYHYNDCKYGFYVMRGTWKTVVAKILSIAGTKEGERIFGRAPFFQGQEVIAEIYKLREAHKRTIEIKEISKDTLMEVKVLSSPGNYYWNFCGKEGDRVLKKSWSPY